jgi:parallel beta-helix repeat protein
VKSQIPWRALLGLCASLALLTPVAAQAAPVLLIDKPGTYVLDKDIVAPADTVLSLNPAIQITASGVTLDLNGHTVSATTPGAGRGIVVENAKGVRIRNGQVGSFYANVMVIGSENVTIEGMQVVGASLPFLAALGPLAAPDAEMGIYLLNTRGSVVRRNTISSTNLGIFLRGGGTTGNVVEGNTVTGGPNPANTGFALCMNPAAGEGDAAPTANLWKGNHATRFTRGMGINGQAFGNILKGNTLAFYSNAYDFWPAGMPSPAGTVTTVPTDNIPKGTVIVGDIVVQLKP